jgi:hypothetical protein
LVRLWRNASPPIRDYLLSQPRSALANAEASDPEQAPDSRLTLRGQRLQRHCRILQAVALRTRPMLRPSPAEEDLEILTDELESTSSSLSQLAKMLASIKVRES